MKRITGHLTEKNGKWYAVVNLYDANGKRKEKWNNLDLPAKKGSKTEANNRLNRLLDKYNSKHLYLMEALSRADREKIRISDMLVEDYLLEWLESHKNNISVTTYETYKRYINASIAPFFIPMHITVREMTGDEINAYYNHIRNRGLKGTSAQRHHALLHLAFKSAVKRRIIASNPVEQADRPKSVQFIGSYYNAEEIKNLLEIVSNDPMKMVVLLAAYYGLRRSEVLGLKWSAIDFTNKTISIRHKVIMNSNGIVGMDVMKTKSSYRTLPLIPFIEEELLHERSKQEEMKHILLRGYCQDFEEYICVDSTGKLFTPDYVSEHFKVILKNNGMRHIRFHDLRHSCASLLLSKGVPMKMIQDWLGHSDMGTTANIYSHIDIESKKASAQAIGDALRMNEQSN